MAKPRSQPQLSLESAHLHDDAAGIGADHWSRSFFAEIHSRFDDGDFAEMYEEGGRYPVSPGFLASLTILQYLFKASDRVAVENTIMRRDWRIALGITPDYDGFDASVLCRFRGRLVEHGREREILDTVIGRLGELGLLRSRRKLRVDATHIVADVTRLSRAEVIGESMRVVLCAADRAYPELGKRRAWRRLRARYGEEIWVGGGGSRSVGDEGLRELGRDALRLLELIGEREVKGKAVLIQVLEENYHLPGDEPDPPPPEGGERGQGQEDGPQEASGADEPGPSPRKAEDRPKDRIATPHEPDVRYGKKGKHNWLGDKAHLVETSDRGRTNYVIDVLVTDPRLTDSQVLQHLAWRSRLLAPDAELLLTDMGYASATNSRVTSEMGIELIAPTRSSHRRGQIPLSDFDLDFDRRVATCPEGHESVWWREGKRDIKIRFGAEACKGCPRRAECTNSPRGRSLAPSRDYPQLQRDRARERSEEWQALYRERSGIEATISELVHRCGARRSRYRGADRRALHVYLSAAALNVRRMLKEIGGSTTGRSGCLALAAA